MAFTNLRVHNFTLTDSLVFTNLNSPSQQDNYTFCQARIQSNAIAVYLYVTRAALIGSQIALQEAFFVLQQKLIFNSISLTLQTINFTEPFYAPPVVIVTPKHSDNNHKSHLSGPRCNAVTAWVEVRIHLEDIW